MRTPQRSNIFKYFAWFIIVLKKKNNKVIRNGLKDSKMKGNESNALDSCDYQKKYSPFRREFNWNPRLRFNSNFLR